MDFCKHQAITKVRHERTWRAPAKLAIRILLRIRSARRRRANNRIKFVLLPAILLPTY